MKSKDLIKKLQELDHTGEVEVLVGNQDIYFLEKIPMYYDGCGCTLIRDSEDNAIGIKVLTNGAKINIAPYGIEDITLDYPIATLDVSDLNEDRKKQYIELFNGYKNENMRILREYCNPDYLRKLGVE